MSSHVHEDKIVKSVKIVSIFSVALSSLSRSFRKAINTAESDPKAAIDATKKDVTPVFTVNTKNSLQEKFTAFFKTGHSPQLTFPVLQFLSCMITLLVLMACLKLKIAL